MTYRGGKNGAGVYQKIINQIPPHDVYIEAFLGGGAIMKLMRRAELSIGIDVDGDVCRKWRRVRDVFVYHDDALTLLPELVKKEDGRKFCYLDPPYLGSVRAGKRKIYKHEMLSDDDHVAMLTMAKGLACDVAISGYWSELYARELKGWRSISFQAMTRGGFAATEWLWMNYDVPFELHDYSYLGDGYRERERIKRRKGRWVARLKKMPPQERYALLEAVNQVRGKDAT